MRTSFWTKLLDVISPRSCAICGARLTVNERVLCCHCHLHLPLTGLAASPTDNPMARLFWGLLPMERAAAWFYYYPQSDSSTLLYDLKYHHHPELGRQLGCLAARHIASSGFFNDIDAIVPVPLTRRRRWQRGYNQSLEIAKGISEVTGLPIYNNAVKRVHFAESQTQKNEWERRQNVENAFQLTDSQQIAGKHLLIVDDIVTTGATAIACGQELARAEGVRLSIFSLGLTKS